MKKIKQFDIKNAQKLLSGNSKRKKEIKKIQQIVKFEEKKEDQENLWIKADSSSSFINLK